MKYITSVQAAALLWSAAVTAAQDAPSPYLRVPSERQLDWQRQELYAFLHFGPNTFTGEEWGRSQSLPDVFNPSGLDTDQWAKVLAEAGMKGMILTAKHHDGMCLWNTSTTAYKIGNGSWAKGREQARLDTDIVRMAAGSAKKYGIKFGVYLSPWDIHRDPAMPKPGLAGTIYDEPQIFGDASPGGDYNALYTQQLTELVTMQLADGAPVELFEVWLDGASGSNTAQTFDWAGFRDVIRRHQPGAVMWGHQGPDARWVGNEDGYTRPTNWHAIDRTQDDARYAGEELERGVRDGRYWTPAESDARIRDGWFYHPAEPSKAGAALMDMYLKTVGYGVNLLLDVPPDTRGLIADSDAAHLRDFAGLRKALDRNLVTPDLQTSSSSVRAGDAASYGPGKAIDARDDTYWTMDDGESTGWMEIDLGGVCCVDGVILQEHIKLGQRIGGYEVDAMVDGGTYRAVVSNGTSMGYKRIDLLDNAVETSRIRLRITQANAVPLIQNFQVLGSRNCTAR